VNTESLPQKAIANPYALHGTQGRLIVRLQRFSVLGWILFFLLLIGVMGLVAVSTLAPKPIVAVDAAGRVLGTLEYLSPSARSDQEVQATAAYVAQSCMSLNADTIAEDLAECMNMMAEPLYNHWIELLKTGYVSRIHQAGARSTVLIPSDGVTIVERKGLTATVQVHGKLMLNSMAEGRSSTDEKPFALELTLTAIPRSTISTRGFRLEAYKDI
jgi:hypothetical protein